MSRFEQIPDCPPDPIFGVEAFFNACPLKEKQLLAVGVYRDAKGLPYTFPSVAQADDLIIHKYNKEYIPMIGFRPFLNRARTLLWTDDILSEMGNRIATVQTAAGTGGLHLCSHLCKSMLKVPQVMISDPAWPSYSIIFGDLGHTVAYYPYIKEGLLNLDGICDSLEAAPEGSLIVLQVCGHNPTGIDPTYDEWQSILRACRNRHHLVLFDFAYMGFASGDIDEDARVVRECARSGMEFLCSFSFSKCMGLYCDRIGALHAVSSDPKCTSIIEGQLVRMGRSVWSVAPANGAYIVDAVLGDPELRAQWREEVTACGRRLIDIRNRLCDVIEQRTGRQWPQLRTAKGMFAYTGLNPEQVQKLAEKRGVFLVATGRIAIPLLNSSNVDYVANSIADIDIESR